MDEFMSKEAASKAREIFDKELATAYQAVSKRWKTLQNKFKKGKK